MVKKLKKRFCQSQIVLLLFVFFQGCANQLPPGGGEIDRIPPEVVEVYPESGTTNYNENYFEITFSEFVEKRSVKDALFFSPFFEKSVELDWSGRTVRVNFPEELKDNTTYVITLGTDVEDHNNRNKMLNPFNLTFSTGSEIHKKSITGKVYSQKPSGTLLYTYRIDGNKDSLLNRKPDFISQAGADGSFSINGLSEGNYRVFAVKDEFRDMIYQVDQDEIGIPNSDITLKENDSLVSGLNFRINKVDLAAPRILTTTMPDQNHIIAAFSERLDSSTFSIDSFYIYDSTSNHKYNFSRFYKNINKPEEIVLVNTNKFEGQNNLYLIVHSVQDKKGNIQPVDYSSFYYNSLTDTTKPLLIKSVPENLTSIDFMKDSIQFYFNDAVDSNIIKERISLEDTSGNKIPSSIHFLDDASFIFSFTEQLLPSTNYFIIADLKGVKDIAGNSSDTTFRFRISTLNNIDFTGASGILKNADLNLNPYVVLQNNDNPEKVYFKEVNENGSFLFERILPGKYTLWAFYDLDNNESYTPGSAEPFIPAEKFFYHPAELNLRARWQTTDIVFELKP